MTAGLCLDCNVRLTKRNAYKRGKELQLRCKKHDNANRVRRGVVRAPLAQRIASLEARVCQLEAWNVH
jgi:hypothetical protein